MGGLVDEVPTDCICMYGMAKLEMSVADTHGGVFEDGLYDNITRESSLNFCSSTTCGFEI